MEVIDTLAGKLWLTTIKKLFDDVTGEFATQRALDVITQFTTSALFSVELDHVVLLVPTFIPFSCHWKEGLPPPFEIVPVVNVTKVPAQIAPVGFLTILKLAFTLFNKVMA